MNNTYLIGQRVLYGNVICTVCVPYPKQQKSNTTEDTEIWIDNPEKGYKHFVSKDNIKPLPNGQL